VTGLRDILGPRNRRRAAHDAGAPSLKVEDMRIALAGEQDS